MPPVITGFVAGQWSGILKPLQLKVVFGRKLCFQIVDLCTRGSENKLQSHFAISGPYSKPHAEGTFHAAEALRKPSRKGFDVAFRPQLGLEHCSIQQLNCRFACWVCFLSFKPLRMCLSVHENVNATCCFSLGLMLPHGVAGRLSALPLHLQNSVEQKLGDGSCGWNRQSNVCMAHGITRCVAVCLCSGLCGHCQLCFAQRATHQIQRCSRAW